MTSSAVSFFLSGNILHIKDYQFDDGIDNKDKILIVLYANDTEAYIIQSLTTSKDKTKNSTKFSHGCNHYTSYIHFYFFDKNINIGLDISNKDFKFDLDTYVYFTQNVKKVNTTKFAKYIGGINIIATLSDKELKSLISCMVGSFLIPKEEQEILRAYLKTL